MVKITLCTIYSSFIFFLGVLDYDWIWHRYEWQSRTAIHAHGVAKLKNDPGIIALVSKVYAAKLLQEQIEGDPEAFE